MTLTVTIAGNVVSVYRDSLKIDDKADEQSDLSFTVIDLVGTAYFTKDQPVTISDSSWPNISYSGYINNQPEATSLYPQPGAYWNIDVRDETWLLNKRSSQKVYQNQYAGTIFVDLIQRYGAAEGLSCKAALQWIELLTEWQGGTLSGTVATTNASDGNPGDGDLELSPSGTTYHSSPVSRSISTVPAVAFSGYASSVTSSPVTIRQIWSGSQAITGSGTDYFQFDVWISSTSPSIVATCDFACSDGTLLSKQAATDDQGFTNAWTNDLSGVATNQWYTRKFFLGGLAGKTLTSVNLVLAGNKAGTYSAYFKNIFYFVNPTTVQFFGSSLAANNQLSLFGYSNVSLSLVTAASANSQQIAVSAGSYSGVVLAQKSQVSWTPIVPAGCSLVLESSLDNQASWQALTNGAAIPNLLAGVQISLVHLSFRATLKMGPDPTQVTLGFSGFSATITSAYSATKTDLEQVYGNATGATAFSAGTLTNTQVASSQLTLSGVQQSFNGTLPGMTFFNSGTGSGSTTIVNKQLQFQYTSGGINGMAIERLDFAGQWQNFTAEVDVSVNGTGANGGSLVYRTTGWQNTNDTYAYVVTLSTTQLLFGRGTNTSSGGGSFTQIGTATVSLTTGSVHRLKAVVSGNSHTFYVDGIQLISATDSTWPAAGYFGLRQYNNSGSTLTTSFANFGVVPALSGTWQSAALSIASPTTYGTSAVAWDIDGIPDNTCSIAMQSSVDGGSTFQNVTNGAAIPNLTAGQALSGKTLILKATLSANSASLVPVLNGVSIFVLGQYISSGFWTSPSLSLASVGRANTTLVGWNANLPTGTSLSTTTSIDGGSTWQSVASSDNSITGITTPPDPFDDSFSTNTSSSYIQSNFGGTTGSWSWDTTHSRLAGSGGNGGTLIYTTALTYADNLVSAILDQCDGSGLIANYASASAMYYCQIWDASGTGTQNVVKLFKRSGGVSTQIGSTATIAWTRGRYKIFILDVQAGVITVSMDGTTLITYTDGSPLAAGKSGLLLNTLIRSYDLRIKQYGQTVTSLSVLTKLTLTSTDPTATPQVLDLQTFVSSEDIDPGSLLQSASYQDTYLSDNANDLNTQCATTWWYVRGNKSVVFRQRTATPAPWVLDSANSGTYTGQQQGDLLISGLKLTPNGDLYRNRQILTNVQGTKSIDQAFTGDGKTRTWNVAYPLVSAPTITLNGQAASVGLKGSTGSQFYYQVGSTAIDQDSGQTILQQADTLIVAGTGSATTRVVRDNATPGTFIGTLSQAELAAIDSTSGIVENILDVSSMNLDVAAAQAYGDQLLQKNGVLGARTLTFSTLRAGLAPGQQFTAFVPEQNCLDVQFLITEVVTSAQVAPSVPGGVLYQYDVTACEGNNMGSPWKMLSSLLK